jgi:hypothetical protein
LPVRPKRGGRRRQVAAGDEQIQAFKHHDKGAKVTVDASLDDANPEDFDRPDPDALRLVAAAIDFVRHFVQAEKPIGAGALRTEYFERPTRVESALPPLSSPTRPYPPNIVALVLESLRPRMVAGSNWNFTP